MKKYNSFLGAFLSGEDGKSGYNAGYRRSALAQMYSDGDPNAQREASNQLARIDPEASRDWQQDQEKQVQKHAQLLNALGKDNPIAIQAWQRSIKPSLVRMYGEQASSLPDVPDDSIMQYAQQLAGSGQQKKYNGAPVLVQTPQGARYARYGDNGMELTDFAPANDYTPHYDDFGNVTGYNKRTNQQEQTTAAPIGGQSQGQPQGGNPANFFQGLSQKYGAQITSINRTPQHNAEVGGVSNSYHLSGQAGDFVVPPQAKQQFIAEARSNGFEAIDEGDHIHLEPAKRGQPQQARVGVLPPKDTQAENAPSGYRFDAQGNLSPISGGPADPASKPSKAWTPAGMDKYNKIRTDVQVASTLNTMMDDMVGLFNDPAFELGPVQNKIYEAQNWSGQSTPQSRSYAKLKSNFEKMRNDSLRLNTGVQTDGDAQRAWSEILQNMNDKELVKARLADIQRYNEFALNEKRTQMENFEGEFGAPGGQRTQQNKAPSAPSGKAPAARNSKGWTLHTDANGNKAYVSPDGKQFEEAN